MPAQLRARLHMELLLALYRAAMKGKVSAQIAYLRGRPESANEISKSNSRRDLRRN